MSLQMWGACVEVAWTWSKQFVEKATWTRYSYPSHVVCKANTVIKHVRSSPEVMGGNARSRMRGARSWEANVGSVRGGSVDVGQTIFR